MLELTVKNGLILITASGWKGMKIGPARCRLTINGKQINAALKEPNNLNTNRRELIWRAGLQAVIRQTVVQEASKRIRWQSALTNTGRECFSLDYIDLLSITSIRGSRFDMSLKPAPVRILENDAYHGQVRSMGQIMTGADGRKSLDGKQQSFNTSAVALLYSGYDGLGLLIGFETFNRFNGRIKASAGGEGGHLPLSLENVDRGFVGASHVSWDPPGPGQDDRFREMSIGFGGGNLPVEPGETIRLEEFVMEVGPDPFRLLERYADRISVKYHIKNIPEPFANWCSWYPYRLGVTEQRLIDNARSAKKRYLDRLGLRFIQADLGWEKNNIPTYFEENERFPHGLKWLSEQLEALGFELGAWKGFTCVSGNHPVAVEHADWLVHDAAGKPGSEGRWFWEPHDEIFHLDITHPEARQWVKENIASLAERGVRYLKWDFGGNLKAPGIRHNPKIACSDALEGMRLAGRIVSEAMNFEGKEGLVLDCTTCETANIGCFKMFYSNCDTGNTGLGFNHLRDVFTALGAHLFKNRRWGLLQPSCLVVGLPGTLEEARMRATAVFLAAGHVDISDNLTDLPEDRWQVLLSVLPPIQKSAEVVDLFYPVRLSTGGYQALTQGKCEKKRETCEPQGATVWHVKITANWDRWHLVGLFNYFEPEREGSGAQLPMRFEVDFKHLELDPGKTYWAHEFWSGQFLGRLPMPRGPEGAYRHPGDLTALAGASGPGMLDMAFCGPAVKLLVIRKPRRHPWPVGTTFHQSGGLELAGVSWDAEAKTLSGELHRPPGQSGSIIIGGAKRFFNAEAVVSGIEVPVKHGSNGSLHIPVITWEWITGWSIEFKSS